MDALRHRQPYRRRRDVHQYRRALGRTGTRLGGRRVLRSDRTLVVRMVGQASACAGLQPRSAEGKSGHRTTQEAHVSKIAVILLLPLLASAEKKFKTQAEYDLFVEAGKEIARNDFAKAAAALDKWKHECPDSDYRDD